MQSNSSEPALLRAEATVRFSASRSILEHGVLAGVLGGLVVAAWFLALDLLNSRPFFTPSLLGSVVFAGTRAADVEAVNAIMVFAYTGLHWVLYLVAGILLSWMFWEMDEHPQFGIILILLFVVSQAVLFGLEVTVVPQLVGVLGAFSVGLANILSAVAMFWFLLRRHPRVLEHLKAAMQDKS